MDHSKSQRCSSYKFVMMEEQQNQGILNQFHKFRSKSSSTTGKRRNSSKLSHQGIGNGRSSLTKNRAGTPKSERSRITNEYNYYYDDAISHLTTDDIMDNTAISSSSPSYDFSSDSIIKNGAKVVKSQLLQISGVSSRKTGKSLTYHHKHQRSISSITFGSYDKNLVVDPSANKGSSGNGVKKYHHRSSSAGVGTSNLFQHSLLTKASSNLRNQQKSFQLKERVNNKQSGTTLFDDADILKDIQQLDEVHKKRNQFVVNNDIILNSNIFTGDIAILQPINASKGNRKDRKITKNKAYSSSSKSSVPPLREQREDEYSSVPQKFILGNIRGKTCFRQENGMTPVNNMDSQQRNIVGHLRDFQPTTDFTSCQHHHRQESQHSYSTNDMSTASPPQHPKKQNLHCLSHLNNDEHYQHIKKAGTLWQSLMQDFVDFPKSWMLELNGSIEWKYLSRERYKNHTSLLSIIKHPSSKGRLLLHLVVLDTSEYNSYIMMDVVIGCYHPSNAVEFLKERKDEQYRDVWLGIRCHNGPSESGLAYLLHKYYSVSSTNEKLLTPIGGKSKNVISNKNLRFIFGEKPPIHTVMIKETDLLSRLAKYNLSPTTESILASNNESITSTTRISPSMALLCEFVHHRKK